MGGNHHQKDTKGTKLVVSILLNVVITASQVIGGIISGSLALLSDALHNFSDVLSLLISYVADRLSKRSASTSKTFGYKRAEIIAAFINSSTLLIVAVILIIESIERFVNPQEIESNLVIWLSAIAIVANGLSVLLLRKEAETNMNMRSAYLHLLTDMSASVAVLIGGLLMKYYQMWWVDSVLTLAIALYLIYMGYDLFKQSLKVLMLFTPEGIDIEKIINTVNQYPSVEAMHHVHVWQANEHETHLEAHLDLIDDIKISEFDALLLRIEAYLHKEFRINHVNIQPEFNKNDAKDVIVQD
ncbi:cation diffusion facilitator family transporter [Gilvibacter sediminis]|uniref:cation diffusion facilitator family transporter n=1 Tax=Gilvibacter sediminis TaxID=379071 RepID=UPI00234FE442|nr:cation diffusion facilitator family transporter [Gilvibacter sediminis]MDC7996828.1 cation diffusion facilitator family transporter [Gilvibacter sediminis]